MIFAHFLVRIMINPITERGENAPGPILKGKAGVGSYSRVEGLFIH
jgi:hypothetical protein